MKTCTFFGHRDCSPSVHPQLYRAVVALIEEEGVRRFLVGSQGEFDAMARRVLEQLECQYDICYDVVLAYLPTERASATHTLMPPDFEQYPKRFAIEYRNRYMLRESDYVVTYITRNYGGAAKFAQMALRQNKTVINIAEAPPIG